MANLNLNRLQVGKTYNIKVRAFDDNGNYSPYSLNYSFTVPNTHADGTPITASNTSVIQTLVGGAILAGGFDATGVDQSASVDFSNVWAGTASISGISGSGGVIINDQGILGYKFGDVASSAGRFFLDTHDGNAYFRGELTATTANIGGSAGIIYNGSTVVIGTGVTILGGVSASQIIINPYNYWLNTGSLNIGGSANFINWDSTSGSLAVVGTINKINIGRGGGDIQTNLALGEDALKNNQIGNYNVAIGYQPLYLNASAGLNVAIGYQTLYNNRTGGLNVAIGRNALYSSSTSNNNIAIGDSALYNLTVPQANIAIGAGALQAYSSSLNFGSNIAIGYYAGNSFNNGGNNIMIGETAMLLGSGGGNIAIGEATLYNASGVNSIAMGYYALYSGGGNENIALGNQTLYSASGGGSNIAIGSYAMRDSVDSSYNIAIGTAAGYFWKNFADASYNIAIGNSSQYSGSFSQNNVSIGANSLYFNSYGDENVAVGKESLYSGSYNHKNIAVGYRAGYNVTGSANTILGSYAGPSENTWSHNVVLSDGDGHVVLTASGTSGLVTIPGTASVVGRVTASAFVGDGSLLTNLPSSGTSGSAFGNLSASGTASLSNIFVNSESGSLILHVSAASSEWAQFHVNSTASFSSVTYIMQTVLATPPLNVVGDNGDGSSLAIGGDFTLQTSKNNPRGIQRYNTAIADYAGNSLYTGEQNTFIGYFAAHRLYAGSRNIALGYAALRSASGTTSGSNNVALGYGALDAMNTGNWNIAVGSRSGSAIAYGSANVILGGYPGTASQNNLITIADGIGNIVLTASGTSGLVTIPGTASVVGRVTASAFVGDGSGLTNLPSSGTSGSAFTNISASGTASFNSLTVYGGSAAFNSGISGGPGAELLIVRQSSTNEGGNIAFANAIDNLAGWNIDSYGSTASPDLRFFINGIVRQTLDGTTGNASFRNTVFANAFVGDGSGLTGISGTTSSAFTNLTASGTASINNLTVYGTPNFVNGSIPVADLSASTITIGSTVIGLGGTTSDITTIGLLTASGRITGSAVQTGIVTASGPSTFSAGITTASLISAASYVGGTYYGTGANITNNTVSPAALTASTITIGSTAIGLGGTTANITTIGLLTASGRITGSAVQTGIVTASGQIIGTSTASVQGGITTGSLVSAASYVGGTYYGTGANLTNNTVAPAALTSSTISLGTTSVGLGGNLASLTTLTNISASGTASVSTLRVYGTASVAGGITTSSLVNAASFTGGGLYGTASLTSLVNTGTASIVGAASVVGNFTNMGTASVVGGITTSSLVSAASHTGVGATTASFYGLLYGSSNFVTPFCKVYLGTNASVIPNSTTTYTNIVFTTEVFDTHNMWTAGNSTGSYIQVPITGMYHITANYGFAANSTGTRIAYVGITGSAIPILNQIDGLGTGNTTQTMSFPYRLNAGDQIYLALRQNSGGNLGIYGAAGAEYVTGLSVAYIGPA